MDAGLPYSSAVRRIEVFSPKISRRVCLNGYDALRVWVTLEANPLVTRFCERPAYLDPLENKPSSPCIYFWVQLRGQTDGELWLIEGSPVYDRLSHDGEVPSNLHGLPVRALRGLGRRPKHARCGEHQHPATDDAPPPYVAAPWTPLAGDTQ